MPFSVLSQRDIPRRRSEGGIDILIYRKRLVPFSKEERNEYAWRTSRKVLLNTNGRVLFDKVVAVVSQAAHVVSMPWWAFPSEKIWPGFLPSVLVDIEISGYPIYY